MPKITERTTVVDGIVMGYVRTNKVGSKCEFEICTVEEWELLSEEEAEDMAKTALYESGQMEWNY